MSALKFGRYLRVSSEEQALPGTSSIEAQAADTEALIAREGGVLVDTYCDDKRYRVGGRMVEPSGERSDRPEWRRLLADIQAGRINAVAAWHSSRLFRNYRPAIDFLEVVEEHEVYVRLVTESFDRRFAMLQAWAAKQENSARVDRIHMGRQKKARDGFSPTNHSRFYRTIRNEAGERVGCEFRAEYRAFFDDLAALFLSGLSYQQIALRLGRHPLTGGQIHEAGVRRILANPWFRGQIDYGRQAARRNSPRFTAPGLQPAAWSPALVSAIEAELGRRAVVGRSRPHTYTALFAGLVRCGHCGRLMIAQRWKNSAGAASTLYTCHSVYKARLGVLTAPGLPHASNSISERQLLVEVEELKRALLAGALDDALQRRLQKPKARKAIAAPTELGEQVAARRAELAQLPATATYARALSVAELERVERAYAEALAEYEQGGAPEEQVDPAALALAARQMDLLGPLAEVDAAELRPLLEAFQVFYIADRELSGPPAFAL